ncbi:hypothetical protein JA9_004943 [Meyerozyma sp. JA9]|nr:hypothetical protein JA9_004943 [Meyerozyma sp. JA9]
MTNWDLIPIVPYLLMTPIHGLFGCVYAYAVKLAVDDETYRTFCKKQCESFDVLMKYCGYDPNEDDDSKPKE